jgi:hypothetical protein
MLLDVSAEDAHDSFLRSLPLHQQQRHENEAFGGSGRGDTS